MPRQDVPYGGAICRLKERIAEIWNELGKKLHSINGVEGDGAGDVKIVSGDAAVVVTSDQVNHEIEIALDSSQLPAASVASVNGQTGAVVLDASDINVIGGSDVETDLANLDADLQQAQTDIATEALARANADSTLQGNINAALATIPGEVSSQIANDATIAQLVAADAQNVKLTGNQAMSGNKTVPTPNLNDNSQLIANTAWAMGASGLLHTFGNESKSGLLELTGGLTLPSTFNNKWVGFIAANNNTWYRVYKYDGIGAQYSNFTFLITSKRNNNSTNQGKTSIIHIQNNKNVANGMRFISLILGPTMSMADLMMTKENTDEITLWVKGFGTGSDGYNLERMSEFTTNGPNSLYKVLDGNGYVMTDDGQGNITGYTDEDSNVHVFSQVVMGS